MPRQIGGIHHVTAIASNPQTNVDFYTQILGLRLVKLTVNFDDPESYHIYYGDNTGRPGSLLTFFIWPDAPRGRHGTGQVSVTSFSIPVDSMAYWIHRLRTHGFPYEHPITRFGEQVLVLFDTDGLQIELVATPQTQSADSWLNGPIPPEHAITGIHGITLSEEGFESTSCLLTDILDFRHILSSGNRFRFETGAGGPGTFVDILCLPAAQQGKVAIGTVHHVAYRTPDKAQQLQWRSDIASAHLNVTPVMDRKYFHSIYFREPGGVQFEIATDEPGFSVDESPQDLGTRLMLPFWLEPLRGRLEHILPSISMPKAA